MMWLRTFVFMACMLVFSGTLHAQVVIDDDEILSSTVAEISAVPLADRAPAVAAIKLAIANHVIPKNAYLFVDTVAPGEFIVRVYKNSSMALCIYCTLPGSTYLMVGPHTSTQARSWRFGIEATKTFIGWVKIQGRSERFLLALEHANLSSPVGFTCVGTVYEITIGFMKVRWATYTFKCSNLGDVWILLIKDCDWYFKYRQSKRP